MFYLSCHKQLVQSDSVNDNMIYYQFNKILFQLNLFLYQRYHVCIQEDCVAVSVELFLPESTQDLVNILFFDTKDKLIIH
jgi:hypothetical protein